MDSFPGLKRPVPVTNYTVSSTIDVKNEWNSSSSTSIPTFLANRPLYPAVSATPTNGLCMNFTHAPPTIYNLSDRHSHTITSSLFLSFSVPRFRPFYNDSLLRYSVISVSVEKYFESNLDDTKV